MIGELTARKTPAEKAAKDTLPLLPLSLTIEIDTVQISFWDAEITSLHWFSITGIIFIKKKKIPTKNSYDFKTKSLHCKCNAHKNFLIQSNIKSVVTKDTSLQILIYTSLCNFYSMLFILDSICRFSLCRSPDPNVLEASGNILQFHECPTGEDWLQRRKVLH